MTQQTDNDPGTMLPSLRTKLQQFVDGLTPEEGEQLRVMQPESGTAALPPSLRMKLQEAARGLTPEEKTHLGPLPGRARAGAAAAGQGDTEGHMIAQDRVLPGPEGTGGGNLGGVADRFVRNVQTLLGSLPDISPW